MKPRSINRLRWHALGRRVRRSQPNVGAIRGCGQLRLLGRHIGKTAPVGEPDGGGVQDRRPGDAVVGPRQLYRVVGVEGPALVGQLGLELGREAQQGVVFNGSQPMLQT